MRKFSARILPILLYLLSWHLLDVVGLLEGTIFPSVQELFLALVEAQKKDFLLGDLTISLRRVIPGLAVGSFLGACLGVATGRVFLLSLSLGPGLHFLRALPAVALVPVFIQLFGINEFSKFIMIAVGTFFPVWINAHEGASLVDRRYIDLAACFKLSKVGIFLNIIIPWTVPFVIAGVRTAIGLSYIMLFVSEWIGASSGIGYRISSAYTVYRMDLMMLSLVELGALAYLTDFFFGRIVRYILPWLEYTSE